MELTRTEENKNRAISAIITAVIFGLLLLFLILYNLVTPNPAFPETGGGGGQEFALGMMNVGSGDIDYGSMGNITSVVAEKETPKEKEDIVTAENGEAVQMNETKPEVKNNTTVIKPIEKEKVIVKEKSRRKRKKKKKEVKIE